MHDNAVAFDVLCSFAEHGFGRTPMVELAKAAGVTRQTLYNRFKTKEAVLDWAVKGFLNQKQDAIVSELADTDTPVATCLLNAFSRWVGDDVEVVHRLPYGLQIADSGLASLKEENAAFLASLEREIMNFLVSRNVCGTLDEAREKTFLLMVVSNGLLLKCRTFSEFQMDMSRSISAALSIKPMSN